MNSSHGEALYMMNFIRWMSSACDIHEMNEYRICTLFMPDGKRETQQEKAEGHGRHKMTRISSISLRAFMSFHIIVYLFEIFQLASPRIEGYSLDKEATFWESSDIHSKALGLFIHNERPIVIVFVRSCLFKSPWILWFKVVSLLAVVVCPIMSHHSSLFNQWAHPCCVHFEVHRKPSLSISFYSSFPLIKSTIERSATVAKEWS